MAACTVRAARESDLDAALALVEGAREEICGLDRIPEILEDTLRGTGEYHACIAERESTCAGIGVYGLIAGTVGTAALYAVVVAKDAERVGTGQAILEKVVADLRSGGARLLVAEIAGYSSLDSYRSLLGSAGFVEESRVADYFEDGVPLVQWRLELLARPLLPLKPS